MPGQFLLLLNNSSFFLRFKQNPGNFRCLDKFYDASTAELKPATCSRAGTQRPAVEVCTAQ